MPRARSSTVTPFGFLLAAVATFAWIPSLLWVSPARENNALRHTSSRARHTAMKGAKVDTDGIFSPLVRLTRRAVGDKDFLWFRGQAIKAHSDVISQFVSTADSPFGKIALRQLFVAADTDGSGELDHQEVKVALKTLGFEWMDDDKKIQKVMQKADADGNELIDLEEFTRAAPTQLKQNLIKLAKQNGHDLGFLS